MKEKLKFRPIGLNYLANVKFVRTIAEAGGLEVKFHDPNDSYFRGPSTNGKVLNVQQPSPYMTDDQWAEWYNNIFHEIGHCMPENREMLDHIRKEQIDMDSLYGNILNFAEDHRVDFKRIEKFAGMKDAYSVAFADGILNGDFDKLLEASKMDKSVKALHTMMAFDLACRGDWHSGVRGLEGKFIDALDAEGKKWFDTAMKQYADEYMDCETPSDTRIVVDKLMKVFELDPEEEKKKAKQQSKQNGDEGEESQDGEGSESGEGEGKEGKGRAESESDKAGDSEGNKKRTKKARVKYEELVNRKHTHEKGETSLTPMSIDYSTYTGRGPYIPHDQNSTRIQDFSNEIPSAYRSSGRYQESHVHGHMSRLNIPTMVNEARRLMQVATRKRNFYNQKKGRLDTSKIFRVCVPQNSAAERIFKTKTENQALDTAVSILVDFSGSMGGQKVEIAISAAAALESLCRMMRLNVEIAGFEERSSTLMHNIFKPFGKNVPEDALIKEMCAATASMGGNSDGDNVLIAWDRLQSQKQKRKILIVLSDGCPSGSRGDCYTFTKNVVKTIESQHSGDIIGIGIQDNAVTSIYKHNHVIYDVSKLPEALIATLEHAIIDK